MAGPLDSPRGIIAKFDLPDDAWDQAFDWWLTVRAVRERRRASKRLEHINRSLGQRFRRAHEALINELRGCGDGWVPAVAAGGAVRMHAGAYQCPHDDAADGALWHKVCDYCKRTNDHAGNCDGCGAPL